MQEDSLDGSFLLALLSNLGSNSVHVGLSLLGEGLTHEGLVTVLVLEAHFSNELCVLELEQAVSDALAGGESGVLSTGSLSLGSGVVLSEGVNSDLATHVQLVGHGGSADVEPVRVEGTQVLVACCFIIGGPLLKYN